MDFTATQCREKAAAKLADAERNVGRIKKRLEDEASSWLLLATRLEDGSEGCRAMTQRNIFLESN
jgi:nitrate reductase assembly molybdenum cofactor insertion protein NarJ